MYSSSLHISKINKKVGACWPVDPSVTLVQRKQKVSWRESGPKKLIECEVVSLLLVLDLVHTLNISDWVHVWEQILAFYLVLSIPSHPPIAQPPA